MLKSKRKFGVEVEFVVPTADSLTRIARRIHVVHDGSLRPIPFAGEYVSQPMAGASAEAEITRVCEFMKKNGASCENPKTSMHIHLDGRNTGGTLRSSRTKPKDVDDVRVFGFSNKLKTELGRDSILAMLNGSFSNNSGIVYQHTRLDGVHYYSKVELARAPRLNYTYYWLEKPDRFKWLRNSLYFYTLFSDVMENIVSNSRRFGNMYCIPLGASYELSDIADVKNMEQLQLLWYKGRSSSGHYDNSRYHNVNLHSFWDRHGTLEIRSHGGTIDPHKILLWVRLHQTIVDKLEDIEIDDLKLMKGTPKEFVEFLEDDMLEEYVKRLLGYFSNIKIK